MAVAALVAGVLVVVPDAAASPNVYVDIAATGANDGTSWADAFTDLQDALVVGPAVDVHVAQGTYRPHASDREVSFRIGSGDRLIGGYATGGVDGPDPIAYPTILSGDLAGDDLPGFVNNGENSYHVVFASGVNQWTRLDGFTVTGGNADGPALDIEESFDRGAGVYTVGGSMVIANTRVEGNTAYRGGGMYVAAAHMPTIVNTVVTGNDAGLNGGGIHVGGLQVQLIGTLVADNSAGSLGGGIYFEGPTSSFVNGVIADNTALDGGGARAGASVTFTNSIMWGNTPNGIRDGFVPAYFSTVNHSDVQGWTGAGVAYVDVDPLFVGGGDYHLQAGSPLIDRGDSAAVPADAQDVDHDGDLAEPTPDLDGQARIQGAEVDMGVFEVAAPLALTPRAAAVTEGDTGTVLVSVPVTLPTPAATTVEIDWATVDDLVGPGLAAGGDDYLPAAGTLTFEPGDTVAHALIEVVGDPVDEPPLLWGEWGLVEFGEPTGGVTLNTGPFFGLGAFVIVDDDAPPTVIPGGVALAEGDTGSTIVDIPVTLSHPSDLPVSVDWATVDAAGPQFATSGIDFIADAGTLVFAPLQTTAWIPVTVVGDGAVEPDEWIVVATSNPSNGVVGGLYGLGLAQVLDDDGPG